MLILSAHEVSEPKATLWALESESQIPVYISLAVWFGENYLIF